MTGYKQIIKNIVEREVRIYVEKKSGEFINVDSVQLHTDSGLDTPTFDVKVSVLGNFVNRDYLVHGILTEYANVLVSYVSFTRMVMKPDDEEFKPVTEHLFRDELDSFKFDR